MSDTVDPYIRGSIPPTTKAGISPPPTPRYSFSGGPPPTTILRSIGRGARALPVFRVRKAKIRIGPAVDLESSRGDLQVGEGGGSMRKKLSVYVWCAVTDYANRAHEKKKFVTILKKKFKKKYHHNNDNDDDDNNNNSAALYMHLAYDIYNTISCEVH